MPMPAETDTTSPKYLRDKYAIVGVGETTYTRGSGVTTRALGTWAVRNAIEDAGLKASDIDGMLSYQSGDFDLLDLHRRRPRAPAQLLHGRVRRRLVDRGAGRHGDRPDGSRHVQGRGDLPRHERLQPGAHRRHRRARRGAGVGRRAAHARLRLAERRPDVRADLHAPHARLRHAARAGRRRQGDPQRARLEQSEGLLQEALHRRRGAGEPHDLQAAAPARLLRGDRQRHGRGRDQRRPGQGLPPSARLDPRRRRSLQQAAHRHALPDRPDLDRRWPLCQGHPVAQFRRRPGGHRRHRLLRRLHLHHHAAARGLRLLQEGRGRRLRLQRHHPAGRQAAQQHQRRPSLRGLYARDEHGDRERAAAAPRRRRFVSRSGPTASASTPTTTARAAAGRSRSAS